MTQNTFRYLLTQLNFEEHGTVYTKKIHRAELKVDFANEKLIYPEEQGLKINERQTCNFSANENFVVFECVHRLLERGYAPEHLELEPRWKVGHNASGGRADILVKHNTDESAGLLLIECKTAGDEYNKEKNKMESNGGQLFSYLQQDTNVQYLCLYCSECKDYKVEYHSAIVKIIDREEDIDAFKKGDESIKLFRNANNKQERFEVWKETFNLYFHYNGIFEEDVNAYEIELKPLKKQNLRPLSEAIKTFNMFMEILRHNNISDNANAFNRILSLLLCKLVDEEKSDNQILDFQVKEGENAEAIQDRLQRLYAKGMKEHLREEIVYFEDAEINDIIKKYPRQTPIDKIKHIFKQIKYYTHNEFALKEVHNEELFRQNARVLNEVIRLLQNFQFRYNKKQQFLGDFFELLLNHGVKQSEGQFFTPVPLVRFMLLSIGLDRVVAQKLANNEKNFLPRILDYACGAGHFLTESIDELQQYIEQIDVADIKDTHVAKNLDKYKQDTDWAGEYIYGIEKDYRLARTSQIACFLNGDGAANIVYGDGLEDHLDMTKNRFDVIVSNPPYSIKSFRNYLHVDGEKYTLFKSLTENSSEIEALFVERTAQLLRPGGLASIILPSSILQGKGIYTKARELLLEHFEFKAISEFGSGTFGATGTTTVILFLKRRSDDFKQDRHYIADDLFHGIERNGDLEHIKSADLLGKYIRYLELSEPDYQTLLKKKPNAAIKDTQLWRDYQAQFPKLSDAALITQVLEAEYERFYYFMLTLNDEHNPQTVVVITAGEKTTAEQFRGYKFSNRKGSEGIRIFNTNNMFDDRDCQNPQKANSYILKNIWGGQLPQIDPAVREHAHYASLTDMLDLHFVNFDKKINLNTKKKTVIETQWNLVRLGDYAEVRKGTSITKAKTTSGNIKVVAGGFDYAYLHGESNRPANTITISASGNAGFVNYWREPIFASDCITVTGSKKLLTFYAFCILKYLQDDIYNLASGAIQRHVYSDDIADLEIPLPSTEVQRKIITECESVDKAAENATQLIAQCREEVEDKVHAITNTNYPTTRLDKVVDIIRGVTYDKKNESPTPTSNVVLTADNITLEGTFVLKKQIYLTDDLPLDEKKILKKDDIFICLASGSKQHIGKIAYIKSNTPYYAGGFMGILRNNNQDCSNKYLFAILNSAEYRDTVRDRSTGSNIQNLSNEIGSIEIPTPLIGEQQKLVTEIEQLEARIAEAQAILDDAPARKNAILKQYL